MSITAWKSLQRAGGAVVTVLLMLSGPSHAGVYATNTCVSGKLTAAATACQKVLKAWSAWETNQDTTKRDGAIAAAGQMLASAWSKAETAASNKGAECADTTVTEDVLSTAITSAISGITDSINNGADLTDKATAKCRSKLINAAATACQQLLKAEGAFVKGLKNDPLGKKRDAALSKALNKFTTSWTAASCTGVNTTPEAVGSALSSLDSTAVTDTTISPNVAADAWTMITPDATVKYNGKTLTPMCSDGSPYVFFAKAGTAKNKLLVYYYGGGACWDYNTCGVLKPFTRTTGPGDSPAIQFNAGFADLNDPANPFADWSIVAVPYCTGDVHWGNATFTYTDPSDSSKTVTIHHMGWQNAQVVEKWTREHFVNPDVLFVAGSSAGGYGALLNSLYFLQNVYQASKAYVFDDAGAGVITQDFQTNNLGNWGVQSILPTWIPGIGHTKLDKLNLSDVSIDAANFYNPRARFAQYTTSYDITQTTFYALMLDQLSWWLVSCDWNAKMQTILKTTAPNYRYYIGAGLQHTVWGSNKVYTDTMGGVPHLVDWVNAMLAGDPSWTSVECTNCNLEPDDQPSNPKQPPFAADGMVTCP